MQICRMKKGLGHQVWVEQLLGTQIHIENRQEVEDEAPDFGAYWKPAMKGHLVFSISSGQAVAFGGSRENIYHKYG